MPQQFRTQLVRVATAAALLGTLLLAGAQPSLASVDATPLFSAPLGSLMTFDTVPVATPAVSAPADLLVGEAGGYVDLPVTLSAPGTSTVTVDYATANSTAGSGTGCDDTYVGVSGTLTFAPGETTKVVRVDLNDCSLSGFRAFLFNLSSPGGATIATASTQVGIVGDAVGAGTPGLDVRDAVVANGAGIVEVPVLLGGPAGAASKSTVTVEYATHDDSAVAGSDYEASGGTLTFAPGQTVANVPVVIDDREGAQPTRRFTITLSNPSNASIVDGSGVVTIGASGGTAVATPAVSAPADLLVGEAGGYVDLPVTLSAPGTSTVTVDYATANSTAGSGTGCDDTYVGVSGTLTFAPGETTKVVRVDLNDCSLSGFRAFLFNLSSPGGATIATASTQVGIVGDAVGAGTPGLDVRDAVVANGAGIVEVPVLLGGPAGAASKSTVTVEYATHDDSAVAGSDYEASGGTLTFAPGQTVANVPVVIDDREGAQPTRRFTITLSNPSNASIVDGSGVVTIGASGGTAVATPAVSAPADLLVGEAGGYVDLPVTLSAPGTSTVTVDYATANSTAGSGTGCDDTYVGVSGTLTFAPGETTKVVRVDLNDCSLSGFRAFLFNLSSPGGATIATASTQVGIVGDAVGAGTPGLDVRDAVVANGAGIVEVPVLLGGPAGAASKSTVTVEYATHDDSAVAGSDYEASGGTLTFAPGQTVANVPVVIDDREGAQPTRRFTITLSNPSNASIVDGSGVVTIGASGGTAVATPAVSAPADLLVGEAGGYVDLPVTLSAPGTSTVTVDYATANSTAGSGTGCDDTYVGVSGTLTFAPGETTKVVRVDLNDCSLSGFRAFLFNLSSPGGATIATASTQVGIVGDAVGAGTPGLDVRDAVVANGAGIVEVPVLLGGPAGAASKSTVTVEYATHDDSAVAGSDYEASGGTLTFAPGQTVANVPVVIDDREGAQPTRRFTITLSNPSNASIVDGSGVVTIGASGGTAVATPAVSAPADLLVGEAGGYVDLPVTLSAPGTSTVTVDYATANSTAGSGTGCDDTYVGVSGTLTFAPGETTKVVRVDLNDCSLANPGTFTFNLSSPTNATIASASAQIQIVEGLPEGTIQAVYVPTAVLVGAPYNALFRASGLVNYMLEGAPPWLTVSSTGAVTGVPPAGTSSFSFSISATGSPTVGPFTVTVVPASVLTVHLGAAGAGLDVQAVGEFGQTWTARADSNGDAVFPDLAREATVTLSLPGLNEWTDLPVDPQHVTIDAADTEITMPVTPQPTTTLTGTVTDSTIDDPIPGAEVSVVQTIGSQSKTSQATTDDNGNYSVPGLLTGENASTTVSAINSKGHVTQTVDLGTTDTLNLSVVPLQTYDVEPQLYTQEPGGSPQLQPNTWRSEVHFGEYVQTPEGNYSDPSNEVEVQGYPGDDVSLCANGAPAGLNSGCASVRLPNTTTDPIPVSLTLSGSQQVSLTPELEGGATGTVEVSGVEEGGSNDTVSVSIPTGTDSSGGPQTVAVPDAGTWDFTLTSGTFKAIRTGVVVDANDVTPLGTVTLSDTGVFGGTGNAALATQSSVAPGGLLDVTVKWDASQGVNNATLHVDVPAGTTLLEDGFVVDGQVVPATVGADNAVSAPVGDLASGATGTATLSLQLGTGSSAPAAGTLAINARMTYDGGQGLIGTATATVAGVSLNGPYQTGVDDIAVSGDAQPGATVTVTDEGTEIGQFQTPASGYWHGSVTLPDQGQGYVHALTATTPVDPSNPSGATYTSEELDVTYDEYVPTVSDVTLSQDISGGSTLTAPVGSAFPFVYVPGNPLSVLAHVTDPNQVTDATITAGGVSAPATVNSDGTVTAAVPIESLSGPITLNYDEAPSSASFVDQVGTLPTDTEQARLRLPPDLRGVLSDPVADPNNTATNQTYTMTFDGDPAATIRETVELPTSPTDTIGRELAPGLWLGSSGLTTTTDPETGDETISATVFVAPDATDSSDVRPDASVGSREAVKFFFDESKDIVRDFAQDMIAEKLESLGGKIGAAAGNVSKLLEYVPGAGVFYGSVKRAYVIESLYAQAAGCGSSAPAHDAAIDNLAGKNLGVTVLAAAGTLNGVGMGAAIKDAGLTGLGTNALNAIFSTVSMAPADLVGDDWDSAAANVAADLQNDANCSPQPAQPDTQTQLVQNVTGIVDPSGTITDGPYSSPLSGATITILRSDTGDPGSWQPWNADDYAQTNPVSSNAGGSYGWDVPTGWYVVTASAPGHLTATSKPTQVLPPQTGIDLMLPDAAYGSVDDVEGVGGTSPSVTVDFGTWMEADTLDASNITLTDSSGNTVPATVTAVDPQPAPGGLSLTKTAKLVITPPAGAGAAWSPTLTLNVAKSVLDAAGRQLQAPITQSVILNAPSGNSPAGGNTGGNSPGGSNTGGSTGGGNTATTSNQTNSGTQAKAPSTLTATLDNQDITLSTPSALVCSARTGAATVSFKSAAIQGSNKTALSFERVVFWIGKGIAHTTKKTETVHGTKKTVTVTTYAANATSTKASVTKTLKLKGYKSGAQALRVVVTYREKVRQGKRTVLESVTKTLTTKLQVC